MSAFSKNKRIAQNTLLLYIRMMLSMGISLYTSRVVLSTLGVEDYGIYNVVGGVVAMLSVFSTSLSSAASRFFTFELGRNNISGLERVFSVSVIIHIVLAILLFIVAELFGSWFLNCRMNIPPTRITAANWVLQSAIISFVLGIINVPYSASIIAHERMGTFAYIGIFEVLMKLLLVLALAYFSIFQDKLISYSVLLMCVFVLIQIIYVGYCRRNFLYCRNHIVWDKDFFSEITKFAGWNLVGCSAFVLKDQGVNILLNLFFGPVVNAARGISYSVNAAVSSFVGNFMTALNPQITKSYAAGEHEYMRSLVERGSRFSFYILLILALPVLFETDFLLKLWLKSYPEHTVNFVRLVLILGMCDSLSNTLITLQLATGRIRNYQIAVGGLLLMNFPISYFFLKMGFVPELTMVVAIFISVACLVMRLIFLRRMAGLSFSSYLGHVVLNVMFVTICSVILPTLIYNVIPEGTLRFVSLLAICILWTSIVVYFLGCSVGEKMFIREHCIVFLKRIS